MNTDTIAKTGLAIFTVVTEGRGNNTKNVEPVGFFHATSASRPGPSGGLSHFLFRYEQGSNIGGRLWSLEIDAATRTVISMRGNIDSLDDYTELLSDLAKFRIFHG